PWYPCWIQLPTVCEPVLPPVDEPSGHVPLLAVVYAVRSTIVNEPGAPSLPSGIVVSASKHGHFLPLTVPLRDWWLTLTTIGAAPRTLAGVLIRAEAVA